jgi:hypothetical protein
LRSPQERIKLSISLKILVDVLDIGRIAAKHTFNTGTKNRCGRKMLGGLAQDLK